MNLKNLLSGLLSFAVASAAVTLFCGFPAVGQGVEPVEKEKKPAAKSTPSVSSEPNEAAEEALQKKSSQPEKPLVDDPDRLKQVNSAATVWIDPVGKRVVLQGQVCQRDALLEMFACLANTKEHEAVVAVPCKAFVVHAALLAVGAKPGRTVQYDPEYVPASGTEIEITVRWRDKKGKVHQARAQDWIRDIKTGKAMVHPWVFAGSGFWTDERTGKRYYEAESGDFICVSNFSSAMLDLPVKSSQRNDELAFRAFTERIPPLGTPVTLILTPKKTAPPITEHTGGIEIQEEEKANPGAEDSEPPK